MPTFPTSKEDSSIKCDEMSKIMSAFMAKMSVQSGLSDIAKVLLIKYLRAKCRKCREI